jgi:hypothetical protein
VNDDFDDEPEVVFAKIAPGSAEEVLVELYGPLVGRVTVGLDPIDPKPNSFWPVLEEDIVLLSRACEGHDSVFTVKKVVSQARPRFLSRVKCYTADQLYRLTTLAAILRAEMFDVKVISEPYAIEVLVMHSEDIDLPAIARAAGLTRVALGPPSPPCHLCKIPFFTGEQRDRMIALAHFLGAQVLYTTDRLLGPRDEQRKYMDEEDDDAEEDDAGDDDELQRKPNPTYRGAVVLFHGNDIDIGAIADAAGITRDPSVVELGIMFEKPPPGAQPGAEWQSGTWG